MPKALTAPGILKIERARLAIAKCKDLDEAKEIRDQAVAVQVYLRTKRAGIDTQNDAAEIIIAAERRMGEMLRAREKHPGGRPAKTKRSETEIATLADLGISRDEAARAQKLAGVPTETIQQRLEKARKQLERITVATALGKKDKTPAPSVQDRRTAPWFFEQLDDQFGPFRLDAFATADNALCEEYYDEEANGLEQPWYSVTFGNPRFKTMMAAALKHAADEAERGIQSVIIGPTGCSQDWFHELAIRGTCYAPDRRINFLQADGSPSEGEADRDTMIYTFGGPHDNPYWQRGEFRLFPFHVEVPL